MDHKALIASLPVEERAMLCRRSDRAGLVQAGLHLGLIIAGGAYVAWGLPLWGLVLVAQGILVT
ncbi:MAG: fatty acid desaturase, partial [Pseudomonadota bacterium]